LWKKFRRDVSPAVQLLARSPVGNQLPKQLERTFLAMRLLEGQQIRPIARFDSRPLDRPPQVAKVALL
jgi:hypothetical protein